MTCLHPSLPNSINTYIDPKEEHCSLVVFFFLPPASHVLFGHKPDLVSITYIDIHWVCHGNLLSIRGRAGIPLPSTPQKVSLW